MITEAELKKISTIEENANKELVLQFYASAQSGDSKQILSPQFVGNAPGMPHFDRDGFLKGLSDLYAAFPDGHYVNDDVVVEGDKVVTSERFLGTHKGEFRGIPPTGKQITLTAVHIDRVVGGKIVERVRMSDSAELARQIKPDSTS
ncbi:MAG: ester cyclase [Nitrososphaerales archaeon]